MERKRCTDKKIASSGNLIHSLPDDSASGHARSSPFLDIIFMKRRIGDPYDGEGDLAPGGGEGAVRSFRRDTFSRLLLRKHR